MGRVSCGSSSTRHLYDDVQEEEEKEEQAATAVAAAAAGTAARPKASETSVRMRCPSKRRLDEH